MSRRLSPASARCEMTYQDLAEWLAMYNTASRGPNIGIVRTLEDIAALRRWNAVLRTGILGDIGDRAMWRVALAVRVSVGSMTMREAARLLGMSRRGVVAIMDRCGLATRRRQWTA